MLLADGSTEAIEDLEIGDKILVTDPETGKTTTREVVATITTEDDKHFVDLAITTDDGTSTLTSTTTHPFWVLERNDWVDAGDLTPGMNLRTPDGTVATVEDTRHYTKRQRTYDLTIDDIHTYFVLADSTPTLVHNCPNGPDEIPDLSGDSSVTPEDAAREVAEAQEERERRATLHGDAVEEGSNVGQHAGDVVANGSSVSDPVGSIIGTGIVLYDLFKRILKRRSGP